MNANRKFTVQTQANQFVITEVETVDILSWATDRQGAWDIARSQTNPVVFVALDGTRRELGDAFDAEAFERAMYRGHISYELSMTDGFYAPEPFETWVKVFREFPTTRNIDATPATLSALSRYTAV